MVNHVERCLICDIFGCVLKSFYFTKCITKSSLSLPFVILYVYVSNTHLSFLFNNNNNNSRRHHHRHGQSASVSHLRAT